MQLGQEVRQSFRTVGSARAPLEGARVAEALTINPNTVLKAYRELELEGLVEGRPGVGTFVLVRLRGRPSRGRARSATSSSGCAARVSR